MDRRTFLTGMVAGAIMPWRTLAEMGAEDDMDVTLSTGQGKLTGTARGGVRVFKGIPYAEPPVGPLRFRAPQLAKAWEGTRDARRFGPPCAQPGQSSVRNEEALLLNVWTPEAPGPHPVFVWFHGGGNTGGSPNDALFDGTKFAQGGVIVVTVAYRLGSFGFMEMGELLGPEYVGSGSNGIQDSGMALTWIQEHIADYGGDPRRVTIAGESAGAKNIAALMAAPSLRGKFHQAVMESGSGQTVHNLEAAHDVAHRWLDATGLAPSEAKRVLEMSTADILRAQEKVSASYPHNFPYRPSVGHAFLPARPVDMIAKGTSKNVALLIGTNRDESRGMMGADAGSHAITDRELAHITGDQMAAIQAEHRAMLPNLSDLERRVRLVTAEEYWYPSVNFAQAHAKAGGATFMYRFDHTPISLADAHHGWAVHGSEQGFVWDNLHDAPASAQAVADTMHAAWVGFIKTGRPLTAKIAEWPKYEAEHRTTLIFRNEGAVALMDDPRGDERRLWSKTL